MQENNEGNKWSLMEHDGVLSVGEWWQVHMTPTKPVTGQDATSVIDMSNVIVSDVRPEIMNRMDVLMASGRDVQRISGKRGGKRFAGSKREREIAQQLTLFICICNDRPLRRMEDHAKKPRNNFGKEDTCLQHMRR